MIIDNFLDFLGSLWNGIGSLIRVALKAMQFQPMWRTLAEVFFSVIFTFGPFFLLSVPIAESKGDLDGSSVKSNFLSYFDSGEIALPILSLCGAVIAIAFTRRRALNDFLFFLALSTSIIVATISSYLIGSSEEFSQVLYPEITTAGFFLYAVLLFVWGVLGYQANSEKDIGNPEQRAADILQNAKEKRVGGKK